MNTPSKVGGLSALAVLGIGLKLAAGVARGSRHSSSSYSSSAYKSQLDTSRLEEELHEAHEQRLLDAQLAKVKAELESTVERHCLSTSRRRYLEPQGSGLGALFRTWRRVNAPNDVRVPLASRVMGLPVMAMVLDGVSASWCADSSDDLVASIAKDEPTWPAGALERVAPGAWVLHTKEGESIPASAALVAPRFLASLGPKRLVAFAPTDHALALADAANPAAIRTAAKRLRPLIRLDTSEGALESTPLLFSAGSWKPWVPTQVPPDAAEVRRLGEIVEERMAIDLLEGLPTADELDSFAELGAGMPPPDFRSGVKAKLETYEEQKTTVVEVLTDLEEAQIVPRADQVALSASEGKRVVPWKLFAKEFAADLQPVKVDGVEVPRTFLLAANRSN